MKKKNSDIANKHNKLTIPDMKERKPVRSDQAVDRDSKEKIRKLFMKKFPDSPVIEQDKKVDPNEPAPSVKKRGSHSLSALHFFQNNQK